MGAGAGGIQAAVNVLVFAAHPDDVVFMCGGTLARFAQAGHRVAMAVFRTGEEVLPDLPPARARRVKQEEMRRCAEVIGATYRLMGCSGLGIPCAEKTRLWVVEALRQSDPEVIITHDPGDYIRDHRYVAELVDASAIEAGLAHVQTASPPCTRLGMVYYMESVSGLGFTPTDFVDITDVFPVKRRMLECHESELAPWQGHPVVDMMEWIEVAARYRGIQAGVRYAEAFRRAPMWGRMETKRLLP